MDMDINITSEWDAKKYRQVVVRANRLVRGSRFVSSCLMIFGVQMIFSCWLAGVLTLERCLLYGFWVVIPCLLSVLSRFTVSRHVKAVELLLAGEKISVSRLTETCYEVTCGELSQRLPWKCLGTHYHFFDDDTLVILHKNGWAGLVLRNLSRCGVDRCELESILRRSELMPVLGSRKRKIRKMVLIMFGLILLAMGGVQLTQCVEACRGSVRCWDTHIRLLDVVYGESDLGRPIVDDTCREKVVRFLAGKSQPDELLYRYDPDDEENKIGLYARYGDRSYGAFYPCGCVCGQLPGYFEHVKSMHTPTVYLESEKEKWLEQIRPIIKERRN